MTSTIVNGSGLLGTRLHRSSLNSLRAAVLAFLVLAAAGCSAPAETPEEDLIRPSSPIETSAEETEDSWPAVNESGAGPAILTIPRPSQDASFLVATFSCTAGESLVELQEDPRVFMSGTCNPDASDTYQMPLPADVTDLHFTIDVEEGTAYTFTGTFTRND